MGVRVSHLGVTLCFVREQTACDQIDPQIVRARRNGDCCRRRVCPAVCLGQIDRRPALDHVPACVVHVAVDIRDSAVVAGIDSGRVAHGECGGSLATSRWGSGC